MTSQANKAAFLKVLLAETGQFQGMYHKQVLGGLRQIEGIKYVPSAINIRIYSILVVEGSQICGQNKRHL